MEIIIIKFASISSVNTTSTPHWPSEGVNRPILPTTTKFNPLEDTASNIEPEISENLLSYNLLHQA